MLQDRQGPLGVQDSQDRSDPSEILDRRVQSALPGRRDQLERLVGKDRKARKDNVALLEVVVTQV